jgi:ribonuclease HII
MKVAGVDEAGRGPVIGPMVIAGVLAEKSDLKYLRAIGVKDSKLLSAARRETLDPMIRDIVVDYDIRTIKPSIIDRHVTNGKLNWLEAKYMAMIISNLKPAEVYVDACEGPERFRHTILGLTSHKCDVKAMNHGERNIAVAAASILAKVKRDREIAKLQEKYGDIGSGYPSDRKTMRFVKKWVRVNARAPRFARSSWRPLRDLLNRYSQTKISGF